VQPEDSFTFTVNDGSNPDVAGTFDITIADVNDAPDVGFAIFTVNENLAAGAVAGNLNATDLDGDTLTYSIVSGIPDAVNFNVDASGNIVTTAMLDYEAQDSYTLEILVDDGKGEANSQVTTLVVVNVGNVADDNFTLGTPIADQGITAGENFIFVVPADTFADNEPATYTITGPAWLNFNASTETFYIMGADTAGLTVGDSFTVDIGVDFNGDATPETTDSFNINVIAQLDTDMMLREAVERLDAESVTDLPVQEGDSVEVMDIQEGAMLAMAAQDAAGAETAGLSDILAMLDEAAASMETAVTVRSIEIAA